MAKKDGQQIIAMVLAVLAAFIMWVYITNSENPQKSKTIYNVQVGLLNEDSIQKSGLVLLPDQNYSVSVKITGGANEVNSITASDFTLSADMNTDLSVGENKIQVTIQQSPKNVKINTNPDDMYIVVQLDERREKQINVTLDISGTPAQGYESAGGTVSPATVLVSGAAKYVNTVESVSGKVDISGVSKNVSGTAALKALDSNGKEVSNVTVAPQYTDATVTIQASKQVPVYVKTMGSTPSSVYISDVSTEPETVTIIGDESTLSKISKIETQAIDISGITQTKYVDTTLNIPEGIKVLNNVTGIRVTFNVEDIVEKTYNVSITADNRTDKMNYSFSTETVQITVKGTKGTINSVSADNIKAVIDVGDFETGSHEASVKVTLPGDAELVKVNPGKITVTVTDKIGG